jgi:hypothetical protein
MGRGGRDSCRREQVQARQVCYQTDDRCAHLNLDVPTSNRGSALNRRSRRKENSSSQASGRRRANGVLECWSVGVLGFITPTPHYSNHPFVGRL